MWNFQATVESIRDYTVLDNTLLRWAIAVGIAVAAFLVLRIVKAAIAGRARWLAEKRESDWFDLTSELIQNTKSWFLLVLALVGGTLALYFAPKAEFVIRSAAVIALLLQVALWGTTAVAFFINRYARRRMEEDAASVTLIKSLGFLAKVAVWAIVLLLALENVGVDVTAMVAGLGVAGIAVALAAQNVLGDLFASLSIVLDKPFVLGDFINVDDKFGSVEKIGLKTTHLRALSGEQLVFSNADLLGSRIHNYKRMSERRIPFTVGVTYQTPHEKLEAIPGMLREAVEKQENVRFDRAHFKGFGDFSLNFEIVYYVLTPDYAVFMDTQQAINLHIYRRFEEEGIEFAFPTQTIFLERTAGAPSDRNTGQGFPQP